MKRECKGRWLSRELAEQQQLAMIVALKPWDVEQMLPESEPAQMTCSNYEKSLWVYKLMTFRLLRHTDRVEKVADGEVLRAL